MIYTIYQTANRTEVRSKSHRHQTATRQRSRESAIFGVYGALFLVLVRTAAVPWRIAWSNAVVACHVPLVT